MKVILVKVELFDIKKGLILPSRRKMEVGAQSSYTPPMGLLYLGGSLEEEGHTVEVIDFAYEKKPFDTLQKSLKSADAVGLGVYTDNYIDTASVAQQIKNDNPNLPIIIGGPHCTILPNKALQDIPAADISVSGDAEFVIKDIIKALDGSKNLSDIPGIQYKKNKKKIKHGKPPENIKNLDSIAFPSRHLVDKYDYGTVYNLNYYKPKLTSIVTSRGCPFHCTFCTRDVLFKKQYRVRSVENVLDEFRQINDNYRSVTIVDDNFLANPKRVHKIMDGIIKENIDLDLYIYGSRVDTAERNLYEKMKKAGVKSIFYGIESGNQDVLNYYNKGITLNQIRDAVELAHEMGFLVIGSFIFGAPIETKKHLNQTINFACSLPLDIASWRHLIYRYGSEIWADAVSKGLLSIEDGYEVLADSKIGLGNLSKREIADFCKNAYFRFHYRPEYFYQQFIRIIYKRDFTILKTLIDFILSDKDE